MIGIGFMTILAPKKLVQLAMTMKLHYPSSKKSKKLFVIIDRRKGASVCALARRVDVVPGQIYRWRDELRSASP